VWEKFMPVLVWALALAPMAAWYILRLRQGRRLDLGGPSIGEIRSREGDGVAMILGLIDDCNEANEMAAVEQLMERKRREDHAWERSSLDLALHNGYDPELDELIAQGRTAEAQALALDRAEAAHVLGREAAERTYRKYVQRLGGLEPRKVEL
jgi:hypothetical protein